MPSLKTIRKSVEADFAAYEKYLKQTLRSESDYLDSILDYLFMHRGKGLRPLLVLLVSALYRKDKPVGDSTFTGAMVVEMVHTASLVHDDVVDEAYIRHGKPTINALWRSRYAVIAGDFILARCYSIALKSGQYELMGHITGCIDKLCEGEIIQSRQSELLEMTRERYMEIIYKKTASLISTCCTTGAMAAGATPKEVAAMKVYGDNLGLAFQIKDDILDYQGAKTGKPQCQDLRERKITLPLLTLLEAAEPSHRRELLARLAQVRTRPENVEYLRDAVIDGGGVDMAAGVMESHLEAARLALASLPDSEYRRALLDLTYFIGSRTE